jgi:hypothetical protein
MDGLLDFILEDADGDGSMEVVVWAGNRVSWLKARGPGRVVSPFRFALR